MKKILTLITTAISAGIVFTSQAATCTDAEKNCDTLGYTKTITECPNGGLQCPFDSNKYFCPKIQCPAPYVENCPVGSKISATTQIGGKTCYSCNKKNCEDEPNYFTSPNYSGGKICTGRYSVNGNICYYCNLPNCSSRPYTVRCPDATYCCMSQYDTSQCSSISGGTGGCNYKTSIY